MKFGEIYSADTPARKFPLVLMGAERRVPRARTRERGPPSALAEFLVFLVLLVLRFPLVLLSKVVLGVHYGKKNMVTN